MRPALGKIFATLALGALGGCSLHSIATGALADSFSGSGGNMARDDDPELVREAVPFALKTMEQVLEDQPKHVGLLTALASGFTQYGYAFVQQDADRLEDKDVAASNVVKARARRLYLRARNYALRGLEVRHAGMASAITDGKPDARRAALAQAEAKDVPLLYWTAASWALAVSDGKSDMKLVGQLPIVEDVMARAKALDPNYDEGAIWEFYVAYDASRDEAQGGGPKRAKQDLDEALRLSGNKKLGALVSYAESVCVQAQDKAQFTQLLQRVLAYDCDSDPPHRLANLIAQRRARWLLDRTGELFAD